MLPNMKIFRAAERAHTSGSFSKGIKSKSQATAHKHAHTSIEYSFFMFIISLGCTLPTFFNKRFISFIMFSFITCFIWVRRKPEEREMFKHMLQLCGCYVALPFNRWLCFSENQPTSQPAYSLTSIVRWWIVNNLLAWQQKSLIVHYKLCSLRSRHGRGVHCRPTPSGSRHRRWIFNWLAITKSF